MHDHKFIAYDTFKMYQTIIWTEHFTFYGRYQNSLMAQINSPNFNPRAPMRVYRKNGLWGIRHIRNNQYRSTNYWSIAKGTFGDKHSSTISHIYGTMAHVKIKVWAEHVSNKWNRTIKCHTTSMLHLVYGRQISKPTKSFITHWKYL